MTTEQFFEGFLATLRVREFNRVITENDEHHKRFAAVVAELESEQEKEDQGASEMPRTLIADTITGRYREFDDALVSLQQGRLLGAQNPLYRKVDLIVRPRTAHRILDLYTNDERETFDRLAEAFITAKTPA